MFDFEKFLSDLIIKNRRVIVPDLGAFLLTDTASRNKSIIFSTFLRYNDGFLENALRQNGITEQDSAKLLKSFVFNVNNSLNAGEDFRISGLGCFTKDDKGVQFVFDVVPESSYAVEEPSLPASTPITPKIEKNADGDSGKKRKIWIVSSVTCAWAIIAVGIYFLFHPDGDAKGSTAEARPTTPVVVQQSPPADTKANKKAELEPQTPVLISTAQNLHYHVIVGCFAEKINSERFLQKCKETGFAASEILPPIGGLHPVSIGKFATLSEADRKKEDYNAQFDSEAWVYRTY